MRHIRKRPAILLLCVLIVFASLPAYASAAESGTVSIRNTDDWETFAENCILDVWSSGRTVVLEADLDFAGKEFTPVPLFMGTFDGNGHTLRNVSITEAASVTGVFRRILPGGVVSGLTVEGMVAPSGTATDVGGIAGRNGGTLRACTFRGTVEGKRAAGGIAGTNEASGRIETCTSYGTVSGEHRVGGIAGENDGTVLSSVNRADVNTTEITSADADEASGTRSLFSGNSETVTTEDLIDVTDIGGVAGLSVGLVRSCTNEGTVGYLHIGYNVGGIAGRLSGRIEDCENRGKVLGRKDVGGIVGQLDPDAEWNLDESTLGELREMMNGLKTETDRLIRDTQDGKERVADSLNGVLNALDRTERAAETLGGETREWLNANTEAVNALLEAAENAADDLVPVTEALSDVAETMPETFGKLKQTLAILADAANGTNDAVRTARNAVQTMDGAVQDLRGGVSSFESGLSHLSASVGDPDAVRTALMNLDLAAALSEIDLAELGAAATDFRAGVSTLRTSLGAIAAANGELGTALRTLADAGENAAPALTLSSEIAALLEQASSPMRRAMEATETLVNRLAEHSAVRLAELDPESPARDELFRSLRDANEALGTLTDELRDSALSDGVSAVSDRLYEVTDWLVERLTRAETASEKDVFEDVSASETRIRTQGVVVSSRNRAAVEAETNVGGVAGAISIDISFDLEDELDLSSFLSGGAKYVVYAAVADSSSRSSVTARKTAAGGIVGRMDFGVVSGCEANGDVTAGGNYAGGIAGTSAGTLRNSSAQTNLSASNYAGGIAGRGGSILNCLAMAYFETQTEFRGAIAGDADGTVSGNVYTETAAGGVNGFSFAGQAEPLPYDAFLARYGDGDLFRTVTVTFLREGNLDILETVPFGGSLSVLPRIPAKDGKEWVWDDFDRTAITRNLTVSGRYISPITSLASGEEVPKLLAEGVFSSGQKLIALPYEAEDASPFGLLPEILDAYTLYVRGNSDPFTVRLREEEDGTVFVRTEDGSYRVQDAERDGSYVVFPLENGGSFVYVKSPHKRRMIGAGAAVLILTLFIAAIALFRRRKAGRKNRTEGENA